MSSSKLSLLMRKRRKKLINLIVFRHGFTQINTVYNGSTSLTIPSKVEGLYISVFSVASVAKLLYLFERTRRCVTHADANRAKKLSRKRKKQKAKRNN